MGKKNKAGATAELEPAVTGVTAELEPASFLNPFTPGVSYADFVKALGTKSVRDYCQGNLTDQQITGLEIEIEHFKNKKQQ